MQEEGRTGEESEGIWQKTQTEKITEQKGEGKKKMKRRGGPAHLVSIILRARATNRRDGGIKKGFPISA